MKNIILSFVIVFALLNLYAQNSWVNIPTNTNLITNVYDIEIVDGKLYQFYSQNEGGTNKLIVDKYNSETNLWERKAESIIGLFDKLKTEKIGNLTYIVGYKGTKFHFFRFNKLSNILNVFTASYTVENVNSNWEFHAGKNPIELYLLFTTNTGPSEVNGLEYDSTSNSWNILSENFPQDLSQAELQIQSTDQFVYFGVVSNVMRITYFIKGDIETMFAYNVTSGNVLSNGSNWDNKGFVLVGNRNDAIDLYATEDLNNLTYNVPIENTTIDINLAANNSPFNLEVNNISKESSASHGFIVSNFSQNGLGNPNEKFQVIRKDYTQLGASWEEVSPNLIEPIGTSITPFSIKLSHDIYQQSHLAVAYDKIGTKAIKVLNETPFLVGGTDAPNTGLCEGIYNEIYANIEINDLDHDQITLLSVSSLNTQTNNLVFIPNGFQNGVSKFKILGIPSANLDQIVITFTDGFEIVTENLASFTANATPTNVQFFNDPVIFCSNETNVDLTQFVNYYDQGVFKVNGILVNGSNFNASLMQQIAPVGTITFTQNVNGCIANASATYEIPSVPSVDIVTTNSTCNGNTGSAVATINPGVSQFINVYWSNGGASNTISNLAPGPYTLSVFNEFNCKVTALASILSSDININATLTNPSCFGASDGGIDLTITGATNYQIVWSNGAFSQNLSNVGANNYECTLYDESGCEIHKSYELVAPAPIEVTYTTQDPDCSTSNGKIFPIISGGQAPYTRLWSTGATTNNLTNLEASTYTLTITDVNSCVKTENIVLNNTNSIIVFDSIFYTDCGSSNGGIIVNLIENQQSGPVNSVSWDNGSSTSSIYNLAEGNYFLNVNYGDNCVFSKNYFVGTKPPSRNDICVVTVDEETTTNLVVWEKNEEPNISYFNIYRENTQAGNYMLIDTVNYTSISVFNDVIASPLQRSWRYRISAVNTCGVESALSVPNKTLHLNIEPQTDPQTYKLYWDVYEGANLPSNYIINRFTDQEGWTSFLPSVQPSNALVIDYIDVVPVGSTNVDYYISFELSAPCTATWRAQDFNVSRSNKDKGIFNPGEGTDFPNNGVGIFEIENNISLTVYPNPFENELKFNLKGKKELDVTIVNPQGLIVEKLFCVEGENVFSTEKLSDGIYYVVFGVKNENKIYKLVKTN